MTFISAPIGHNNLLNACCCPLPLLAVLAVLAIGNVRYCRVPNRSRMCAFLGFRSNAWPHAESNTQKLTASVRVTTTCKMNKKKHVAQFARLSRNWFRFGSKCCARSVCSVHWEWASVSVCGVARCRRYSRDCPTKQMSCRVESVRERSCFAPISTVFANYSKAILWITRLQSADSPYIS